MEQFRTVNFRWVTVGNMLMFASLYMLFPALPSAMSAPGRLGLPLVEAGSIFLIFIAGLLLSGPFLSYLTDVFQRKKLCLFAFVVLLLMTVSYAWVDYFYQLAALSLVQGMAFGITASTLLSIGVDVTASGGRDRGNVVFARFGHAGIVLGIATGSIMYINYDFDTLLVLSLATGVAGFLCLLPVRVPFRAPIGSKLVTADRFYLPRCTIPAVNMVMIAFIPGLMLPLIHFEVANIFLSSNLFIPWFLIAGIGYFLVYAAVKLFFKSLNILGQAIAGLLCVVVAMSVFILLNMLAGKLISALLLGAGLGLILPVTLGMFVGLSQHCERVTANFTWLLAWQAGLSGGIFLACYLCWSGSPGLTFRVAMILAAAGFIWFVVGTYPWYLKKKSD